MTRDDIIRMAQEAGAGMLLHGEACLMGDLAIERFAYLVAASEREACAKLCKTEAANPSSMWEEAGCWAHAAENCATAIQARSQS